MSYFKRFFVNSSETKNLNAKKKKINSQIAELEIKIERAKEYNDKLPSDQKYNDSIFEHLTPYEDKINELQKQLTYLDEIKELSDEIKKLSDEIKKLNNEIEKKTQDLEYQIKRNNQHDDLIKNYKNSDHMEPLKEIPPQPYFLFHTKQELTDLNDKLKNSNDKLKDLQKQLDDVNQQMIESSTKTKTAGGKYKNSQKTMKNKSFLRRFYKVNKTKSNRRVRNHKRRFSKRKRPTRQTRR